MRGGKREQNQPRGDPQTLRKIPAKQDIHGMQAPSQCRRWLTIGSGPPNDNSRITVWAAVPWQARLPAFSSLNGRVAARILSENLAPRQRPPGVVRSPQSAARSTRIVSGLAPTGNCWGGVEGASAKTPGHGSQLREPGLRPIAAEGVALNLSPPNGA